MIQVARIAGLSGHQNPIYTVEGSKNDNIFFTGGNDKGVVEWSLETLSPIKVLTPVKSSVYSLHATENFPFLAIGERSGNISLFDFSQQKIAVNLAFHRFPIFDIRSVVRKNELIVASEDGIVSIWDLQEPRLLYHFKVSNETVRTIAIDREESVVAFGCKDNIIRLYNLEDYSFIRELVAHTMPVTSLQFSPDNQYLLSGGRDAKLNIWRTSDYELKETITAHMFAVYDIKFHPTAPLFATASRDKSIKIWSLETFRLLKNISREKGIESHSLSVNKITWDRSSGHLISVSDDKQVMVWEIKIND